MRPYHRLYYVLQTPLSSHVIAPADKVPVLYHTETPLSSRMTTIAN